MNHRNNSLDVLRSLAIIAVVNSHAASFFSTGTAHTVLPLGGRGVDLFFALSGWLLGHQLLSELASKGTINVSRFWLRRWFRTLPAYYAVLVATYLWQIAYKHTWSLDLTYLVFGQTYFSDMPYFGVSWSLCVEEHFYLLIAPLLLLLNRRVGPVVLLALLAMPIVVRNLGWFGDLTQTHARWDQCGAGVLLAYLCVYKPGIWSRLCRIAPPLALLGLVVATFKFTSRAYPSWGVPEFGCLVWTGISASFILLANSSPFWRSGICVPGARLIADRAYSLYLTHMLAIGLIEQVQGISFLPALALTWSLSFLLGEVLYRAVERPFMQARERWAWAGARTDSAPKLAGVRVAQFANLPPTPYEPVPEAVSPVRLA